MSGNVRYVLDDFALQRFSASHGWQECDKNRSTGKGFEVD